MAHSLNRKMLTLTLLLAASLAMTSCGRKGDLDAPGTPVEKQNRRDLATGDKTPDTPFLLDPLL